MRFFNKKQKQVAGPAQRQIQLDDAERVQVYESGRLPCQQCGARIGLGGQAPLVVMECPKCGGVNLAPLRVGAFWLFEPLGGGAMGSVYKACSGEALGVLFAVKVLPRLEKNRPTLIQALLNEGRLAGEISGHPCLVSCVDSGHVDGEYFCAFEFVDGDRLDKLIHRSGKMPEEDVLRIALHLLAAVGHIYERGYLYRDMKPENVIVNRKGYAMLFDYGLCMPRAKALAPAEDVVVGSPYYLPPERLWGIGEDAHSEIYSLGMVMFHALTGRTYYDSSEVESLAQRHVSTVRIPVANKMKGARPELVEVLSTMVKQDPYERYQSFADVTAAIKTLADNPPEKGKSKQR